MQHTSSVYVLSILRAPTEENHTSRSRSIEKAMSKTLANEMMHGDRAVTIRARLALTSGGGNQIKGASKVMGCIVGFTDKRHKFSREEFEVWDCDVVIIPKRIYRDGPFKGCEIGCALTSLDQRMMEHFKSCETIE